MSVTIVWVEVEVADYCPVEVFEACDPVVPVAVFSDPAEGC